MSIIKWGPMIEPFEEMDKFFEGMAVPSAKGFTPAVDVYQTDNDVVVEAPLAGVKPQEVDITIENDVLCIKGETKKESEVEDKNFYRKEVRSGSFYRSIALPTHVVGDKANAEFINGMLKITIPKAPEAKPKKIKVNLGKN